MGIEDKLAILAAAARYDVSCASSGSRRKNAGRGLGNAAPGGICHTYTEDGRCVSLLKILYTNVCIYNCAYCVNRAGNDIPRASFTTREIVDLTLDFYRRNYIEGLFLSSGIVHSPDATMDRLVRTAAALRSQGFYGYIHLKCIPSASRELIRRAGQVADRLSVNIELPSEESLRRLTREKTYDAVLGPMGAIREMMTENREDRRRLRHVPAFTPAGQSTQMIIGASPESDFEILTLADRLYRGNALRRVYYSAFVPVGGAMPCLPEITAPPLARENRLYQADWLLRLYGFSLGELLRPEAPFLDPGMDPKQAYALRHPEAFPVDPNTADREMLLRVPGIGLTSADRILRLRRQGRIRREHLQALGVVVARALPYLRCDGDPGAYRHGREDAVSRRSAVRPASPDPTGRRVLVTDGTFAGLLTAIFEAYTGEEFPDAVEADGCGQMALFDRQTVVASDPEKALRVWKGLGVRLGRDRRRQLHEAFLSGSPGVEDAIYRCVRDAVPGRGKKPPAAPLEAHLRIETLALSVRREAHRMKGLVRFQEIEGERHFALIAPRYDVLPLIRRHFEMRFANQEWIIHDTARNTGLFFDGKEAHSITPAEGGPEAASSDPGEAEALCRDLWRRYYAAVNIPDRRNPRLHRQKLPRRYWPYLTEKAPGAARGDLIAAADAPWPDRI